MQFYILLTLLPFLAIGIRGVDRPATTDASPMESAVNASSRVADSNLSVRSMGEKIGGRYLGTTLPGYFLTKLAGREGRKDKNYGGSCTIVITNRMTKYTLINPTVFLLRGSTRDPSPYEIEGSPDGSKTHSIVFNADDKIARTTFVSHGVLIYEISDVTKKYFSIAWKFERTGMLKFFLGAGANTFSIRFVEKPTTIDEKYLGTLIGKDSPDAATVGGYVKEDKDTFQARAHMTNSRDAQLVVTIENAQTSDVRSAVKRVLKETFTIGLVSSVASFLTTTTLRYLPFKTLVVTVTLVNDLTFPLEDPKWHLKNVIIHDYVPFEIGPQEQKQVTFSVPFAHGKTFWDQFKSAAVVLTFKIKNVGRTKRFGLAIWWKERLSSADFNEYSTFLIEENVEASKLKDIANGETSVRIQKLKAEKLQKYMCMENSYRTSTGMKVVTLMATMGDGSESGMKVHISARAIKPTDLLSRKFHDCQKRI